MKKSTWFALIFLTPLLIGACAQPGTATPQARGADVPVVVDDTQIVAEGRIVPNESVTLAFLAGGRVAEILVTAGDRVEAGEVLARLDDREPLEAAVATAEFELAAARLEEAAASADLLAAQQALEMIHETWPDAATLAQQALKDARQRQYNADRNLGYLTSTADQTDIDLAYTAMILAEDALDKAQDAFEPWENKPADNLTRAALQAKLAEAQQAYDAAVRNYNAVSGTANAFDVSQAEAELAIADAQLSQAQADYDELLVGPDPDAVALAEARIAAGEARVAAAAQRILTAQANLAAAQAALEHLDLTAPFAGVIVNVDLIAGQQVAPGVPVLLLADFSSWLVETDNLTELEVVSVAVGGTARIVADALPDVPLGGTITEIGDLFVEKRGDITYTARILLQDPDPRLRWGMTVVVTFEE